MRGSSILRLLSIAFLVAIMAFNTVPASANGVPVKLILTYLTGYSNWGPTGAAGVADIGVRDGYAHITATGLPQLPEDMYEGWLVNTNTNQTFSVGKFNADANGKIDYNAEFDKIPDLSYNFFIISVEPKNDPDPAADARKSIAGFYPAHNTTQDPAQLPQTGEATPLYGLGEMLAVGGGLLLTLCAGVVVGRWSKGRASAGKNK
ncbi:MAG: hypothetical protein M1319_03055 [Chloroflexi bacterium]|nr:hypothetical protein [Chloroflexota bacterium]